MERKTNLEATEDKKDTKKRRLRPLGVNNVLSQSVEEDLYSQTRSTRNEGIPVTKNSLKMMALAVASEQGIENFAASDTWPSSFLSKIFTEFKSGDKAMPRELSSES